MICNLKSLSLLVPALVGLGITGAALASADTEGSGPPFRCDLRSETAGGMVTLEGLVESDDAVTGTYRFLVASVGGAGNSVIRQGGGFSAAPGKAVSLGRVMLSVGGTYDASLEVHANGTRVECDDRVGASL